MTSRINSCAHNIMPSLHKTTPVLFDTSARDGLQAKNKIVATNHKINLINFLSASGIQDIEVASISKLPQMEDGKRVFEGILKVPGVRYWTLIPHLRGYEEAKSWGCRHFGLMASVSEEFSIDNTRKGIREAFSERQQPVLIAAAYADTLVRVYLSCMFGYKKAGDVDDEQTIELCKQFAPLAHRIVICDTTNLATVEKVEILIRKILQAGIPAEKLAGHFHGTGKPLEDIILKAHALGLREFDTSLRGLGGCPSAKKAQGIDLNNAPTEDAAKWLNVKNIDHDKLAEARSYILRALEE